ncbi:cell division protein ZipA [Alteromonas facilis]|uniref:cell division protein ZipA n=1 Tax=Alteromonas facilis TaxID=2048004 RepID=UPI000C289E6B|nr:cell division protein ZipA [Alteromonas facilis]
MEDLRFALLVVGGCAILAILAHGLWSLRKGNSKPANKPRIEPAQQQSRVEGFDEFGLGEVRVVSQSKVNEPSKQTSAFDEEDPYESVEAPSFSSLNENEELEPDPVPLIQDEDIDSLGAHTDLPNNSKKDSQDAVVDKETSSVKVEPEKPKKLYASVVSNPKPTMVKPEEKVEATVTPIAQHTIPEPPPFLLQEDDLTVTESSKAETPTASESDHEVEDFSLDQAPLEPNNTETVGVSDNQDVASVEDKKPAPRKRTKSMFRKRIEPTLGDDQMRMSFDEERNIENVDEVQNDAPPPEQEVLVLNVRAPQGEEIPGAALLPMLLTLGFKFGDQDIFHRHVNSNGKGPVLFSLANMFKPGVFDIDNLENFTTQGVSLFMILPIEGDPHQVFNMMHNAARKLAEEFSGQILDGRRSVLTKQGLQQYVEKIREFERRRMISRT